jgi:hypothetical protein
MDTRRQQFLEAFLGALGAERVAFTKVQPDIIEGAVFYPDHRSDAEEKQDFRWHVAEEQAPTVELLQLASLLRNRKLIHSDRVIVPESTLASQYRYYYDVVISDEAFRNVFRRLLDVEITMLDDGKETDSFFIHS